MRKFWNRRVLGLPAALLSGSVAVIESILDKVMSLLVGPNLGSSGANVKVGYSAKIRYPALIHLGNRVHIGRGVICSTETPDHELTIGDDSQINKDVFLDFSGGLNIGTNCVISERSVVYTHSHGHDPKSVPKKTPLVIEDNVWIGIGAIILPGIEYIGSGSIIGAGAVVTKSVEPGTLLVGSPCREIVQEN